MKIKVGGESRGRSAAPRSIREELGPDRMLMMDANQVWGVDEAIESMRAPRRARPVVDRGADESRRRARARPRFGGRSRPFGSRPASTSRTASIFKQLFQAEAIDFCQLDACRVGGVNEAIAILLLAAKFGVPVCPHAGGVGLCEYVQHLAFFDYIAVSGSSENRVVEWVDHLHEHFRDPAIVRDGRYVAPVAPGYSIEICPESLDEYAFPNGPVWVGHHGRRRREMMVAVSERRRAPGGSGFLDRYGLLQAGLWSLRAGPALILVLLIVVVGLTTPVFLTSRNIGNVFSQTSVIAVLALGQLLVIVTRGIDLSVGATIALSGVVGRDRLRGHGLERARDRRDPRHRARGRRRNGLVFVYGRVPHPFIVTLATLSIVRGIALWASDGTLISGMPPIVQTIGGGSIDWIPYSIFVVVGLASLALC